jgi:hypothetical protein
MIEVRCLHDLRDAQPFRDAMNALNLASVRPDPFSTFEFYANHLRNAVPDPATPQLWLLLAFIEDRLVGYLALKLRRLRVLGLPAAKLELRLYIRPKEGLEPARVCTAGRGFGAAAAAGTCVLGWLLVPAVAEP